MTRRPTEAILPPDTQGVGTGGSSPSNLKPRDVKAPLSLIPARPLRAIAAAMENGARKYVPWNWTEPTDDFRQVYSDALRRHVEKFTDLTEPDYADDSQIHHLAHAGACILILLHKLGIDYPAKQVVKP
jgi:hypothetical protein